MSKGIIYKYTDNEGETVKAVALNDEQSFHFSDYRKVFLRILNDDYDFKKTSEGKNIIAVKNHSDLTRIGHWN
jgi:hypothetical protein